MLEMGEWTERAACRGKPADLFFPPKGGNKAAEAAKAICTHCPVEMECLRFALKHPTMIGIWGATTERERRRLSRIRNRP